MGIEYKRFDAVILRKLAELNGDECGVIVRDDTFPLAAMDGDIPIGFICVTSQILAYPFEHLKDAYIEVLWVDENYRRQGIGQYLVLYAEKWAKEAGFKQIRTHSNNKAVAAIHMWHKLGYGMCPHDYHEFDPDTEEYRNQFSGYWVAKVLNPVRMSPDSTDELARIHRHWWGCIFDRYEYNTDDVNLLLDLVGSAPQNIFEIITSRLIQFNDYLFRWSRWVHTSPRWVQNSSGWVH